MNHAPSRIARHAIATAIACLIVAGSVLLSRQSRSGFTVPPYWLLALFSLTLAIPLKVGPGIVLQKALAVYLVVMGADYLEGAYWPLGGSIEIAADLPVAAAAILSAWIVPRRQAGGAGSVEMAMAVGASVAIVGSLLLVTGLLVNHWYGFGAEGSVGVGGQLAMTLLAGIAAWRFTDDVGMRIAIGIAGIATYSWMGILS